MWQLFQAGFVAAGYQLIAFVSIASAIFLLTRHGIIAPSGIAEVSDGSGSWPPPVEMLVLWADLLTALGVILTNHRHIEITARRIRRASRRLNPAQPNHAARAFWAQLWLAAVGFVILVLKSAPDFLIGIEDYLGCDWTVSFGWPGLMSIGLASFGTNARAAGQALHP